MNPPVALRLEYISCGCGKQSPDPTLVVELFLQRNGKRTCGCTRVSASWGGDSFKMKQLQTQGVLFSISSLQRCLKARWRIFMYMLRGFRFLIFLFKLLIVNFGFCNFLCYTLKERFSDYLRYVFSTVGYLRYVI